MDKPAPLKFNVSINDEKFQEPQDNIYYVVSKNGIFIRRKMQLIDSFVKVDKIPFLNSSQEFAKLNIEKIPSKMFKKCVKFFKEVYTLQKTESVVLLYYNPKEKQFKISVPKQVCTHASAEYTNKDSFEDFMCIGTIHSHSDFGSFHSGIDTNDEKYFDGLHITVGNLDSNDISISSSIISNKKRFKVEPKTYILGITKCKKEEAKEDKEDKEESKYPESWFKNWEKKTYKKDEENNIYNFINDNTLDSVKINKKWLENISVPEVPKATPGYGLYTSKQWWDYDPNDPESYEWSFGYFDPRPYGNVRENLKEVLTPTVEKEEVKVEKEKHTSSTLTEFFKRLFHRPDPKKEVIQSESIVIAQIEEPKKEECKTNNIECTKTDPAWWEIDENFKN